MLYQQTTQVPNIVFDTYLPTLTGAEYKVLSIIIRQTNGWYDKTTGRRKTRDRISHGQFMKKTGLCRRVVSKSLQSLVNRGLVTVGDRMGRPLQNARDRKGMSHLYYGLSYTQVWAKTYAVQGIGEILARY